MKKTSDKDWLYLHPRCHMGRGTWLRLGPDGAHVLECAECRKVVTAFRILRGPDGKLAAESILHEENIAYEDIGRDA